MQDHEHTPKDAVGTHDGSICSDATGGHNSPAGGKGKRRVLQAHQDGYVATAAHAARAVGDCMRLRGRVVPTACLRERAQGYPPRWSARSVTSGCRRRRRRFSGQEGFGGAGTASRRRQATDDVDQQCLLRWVVGRQASRV